MLHKSIILTKNMLVDLNNITKTLGLYFKAFEKSIHTAKPQNIIQVLRNYF